MNCIDVDVAMKADGGKMVGEGHTGMIGTIRVKTRDLKKGISEKSRPNARVGEVVEGSGSVRKQEGLLLVVTGEMDNPGPGKDP